MRIKRFRARDIGTALQMVKKELGPDAVILSTREMKDRAELGPAVEVTAGQGHSPEPSGPPPDKMNRPDANPAEMTPMIRGLEGGIAEIKDLLLDITHRSGLSSRLRDRPDMLRLYRELVEAEVEPAIARGLVERTAEGLNGRGRNSRDLLKAELSRVLKSGNPMLSENGRAPRRIALVGASGVGKTTTVAKLAAYWSVDRRKRVGLVSLDTFRLGATEQIKTYARIIGLPVRIAQDKEELQQALDLFEHMDVVLIDTAGRCLCREEAYGELSGLLQGIDDLRTLLVLSACTKGLDIAATLRRTEALPVSGLVVSKIDETGTYGNVVNNIIKSKTPVSFLTNGQKVPDDILPATSSRLAELIIGDARTSPPKG